MVGRDYPDIRLVEAETNLGFAPAIRWATELAGGDWLAVVNNDAVLEPSCLLALLDAGAANPRIGSVNPQVRFLTRPERLNTTGLVIDRLGIAADRRAGMPIPIHEDPQIQIFGCSGCVALYRMEMLRGIGGFDPEFFAYAEDADVAWRARMAGWTAIYVSAAVAFHRGSATLGDASARKYELVGRNRVRLIAKNATTAQLRNWGWAMILYDLAYVFFVGAKERTLAPLRGRLWGLREWTTARRAGAVRQPVEFDRALGWLDAWRMRRAYARAASADDDQSPLWFER